jgi:hypothetical protein
MQVLYQLSYGPVGSVWQPLRWWGDPRETLAAAGPKALLNALRAYTATRRLLASALRPCHTWRQTATSRPCTSTSSAGSRIGP